VHLRTSPTFDAQSIVSRNTQLATCEGVSGLLHFTTSARNLFAGCVTCVLVAAVCRRKRHAVLQASAAARLVCPSSLLGEDLKDASSSSLKKGSMNLMTCLARVLSCDANSGKVAPFA
jgi:hypothetical protein